VPGSAEGFANWGFAVRIYLLRWDDGRPAFYSDGLEPEERKRKAPERGRMRRWLELKFRKLQGTLKRSQGGIGPHVRKVWRWLQGWMSPDEGLLRGLRSAERIVVDHPVAMPEEEAREAWCRYLSGRARHHAFWLVLNALVIPLAVLLTPIPGPNVFSYWFVFRAVCHALALVGIRRARSGRVPTEFRPSEALDFSLSRADDEDVARVAEALGLPGLRAFLGRVASGRPAPRERETPLAGPAPGRGD
jgi:hypothetical protein